LSYLTEEVLQQQPEEIQQFLLETAVLSKLHGDLCDAVTGKENGRMLLEHLYTANLFLIPLDDEQAWYRYHHLFADLLRTQLQQTASPEAIQTLHSHASHWLAQHGFTDEAIQHALAGDDYATAADLIEKAAYALIFSGQMTTVNQWLQRLPEDTLTQHPRLVIYRTWLNIMQGKAGNIVQAVQEIDDLLNALSSSPENDQLRLEMNVILCRLVALIGNAAKAIKMAQRALAVLPEGDQASRARAYSALAIAYGMEGDMASAEPAYQESLRLAQAVGYYSLAAHTMMISGQGRTQIGQLREAARTYQAIIDMGEQSGQKLFFPAGQGYVGLADIYLEWFELEKAAAYAQKGIELCRQGGLAGAVDGLLVQSRLLQAQGNLKGALQMLDEIPDIGGTALIGLATRQVKIRRALGEVDSLPRWEMPLTMMLSGQFGSIPTVIAEAVQLILIRIYLAQGKVEAASTMLADLQKTAENGSRNGRLVEANLLQAIILSQQGENVSAQEAFSQALALAEPENYVLLFLEEGDGVRSLLQAYLNTANQPDNLKAYAQKLLSAFPGEIQPLDALVEPLSPREQEILNLIGAGYSNQEISDALFITLHTVKKHSSNIYGKLGVSSRTQAVARAHELNLL
jgi:LuxR family maltose regulon positive regulatory protein